MNRRAFLKEVALWSAGLTLLPPLFRLVPELPAETRLSVGSVAEGIDYGALISRVISPLGGIQAFVKKCQRVVVKPNIGWDCTTNRGRIPILKSLSP